MKYQLRYFASLADAAACTDEIVETITQQLPILYTQLQTRHGFTFSPVQLRVAVNGALVKWEHVLAEGDEIVFLPPVSGG